MGDPAKPLFQDETVALTEDGKKIEEKINDTHTDELILTLCGFIGTDIHGVSLMLEEILTNTFNYEVKIIRLSEIIKEYSEPAKSIIKGSISEFNYVEKLIEGGNELRKKYDKNILASLSIQKMSFDRITEKTQKGSKSFNTRRICYIIDSIKNTDELELFKLVYRDIHYSIGIFSPIDERINNLKERTMSEPEISQLIDKDSGEELKHGQKVRDTFIKSDYFLRIESVVNNAVKEKLERFLNLIFGSKVITPTIEETAMYHAASAANNSACLSRQVGAALTDSNGEILSIGWNDVPKFGGGLYKSNIIDLDSQDHRCWNMGSKGCWNDDEKDLMANELVNILISEKIVDESKRDLLFLKIRNSKIKSLVEFSRAIHAEMHAIITASQTAGKRVNGGNLYITTYPCHNCARHIIVAGIRKVYYIEPYKKSLTTKLHKDAITENESISDKVVILMYDGVSPIRYMDLFKMTSESRKLSTGKKRNYNLKEVTPKSTLSLEAIPVLESKVVEHLEKKGLRI